LPEFCPPVFQLPSAFLPRQVKEQLTERVPLQHLSDRVPLQQWTGNPGAPGAALEPQAIPRVPPEASPLLPIPSTSFNGPEPDDAPSRTPWSLVPGPGLAAGPSFQVFCGGSRAEPRGAIGPWHGPGARASRAFATSRSRPCGSAPAPPPGRSTGTYHRPMEERTVRSGTPRVAMLLSPRGGLRRLRRSRRRLKDWPGQKHEKPGFRSYLASPRAGLPSSYDLRSGSIPSRGGTQVGPAKEHLWPLAVGVGVWGMGHGCKSQAGHKPGLHAW
jgi:hypothetical protein